MRIKKYFLPLFIIVALSISFSYAFAKEGLEIKSIRKDASGYYYSGEQTIIVKVKNYSKDCIEDVSAELYAYGKDKTEIANSEGYWREKGKTVKYSPIAGPWVRWWSGHRKGFIRIGYRKMPRDDGTSFRTLLFKIKGRTDGYFVFELREGFKESYGKPKYYKVNLKVDNKLVDVKTEPKSFLEELKKLRGR